LSYFETNLRILARRQPELAGHLGSLCLAKVEINPSASGSPTAVYHPPNAENIPLHSKYDPLREARAQLREYDISNSDYIIILGFGLGYLLDAILEQERTREKRLFIVESDPEILRAAFQARDLGDILSLPNLHFAWPTAAADLARQWQAFFDPVHAQQSVYVMHAASLAVNPEFFKDAAKVIQSQTLQIFADINTLIARADEFLENFVKNIRYSLLAPGVQDFVGLLRDSPGLIVSAGPSLDKNIHELRPYLEKIVILSTDTALKPLLRAGIEPHFILTGDPGEMNYLHLKGAPTRQAYLVAELTTYPASFEDFRDRTICCTFDGSALRSFCDLVGNKGKLRAWGSVATMTLDFALLLGCDPIIFIGQDLAYSNGRTYCSGVYFIEDRFRDVADPETWQRRWEEIRAGAKRMVVQDIFGRSVETTDRLVSYWNWFVKELALHPNIRFINATEGGILKENVAIMSLREALYRYCGAVRPVREQVRAAYDKASSARTAPAAKMLVRFKEESSEIQKLILQGRSICRHAGSTDPRLIRQKFEAVKNRIYANIHLSGLIDTFNQMGNVSFLRKMAAIEKSDTRDPSGGEIINTCSEYLDSVAQAMDKINAALLKIEGILGATP
jgi:hypothetical protein